MLDRMTWQQLCGWVAYHRQNPFGEARADLRTGILASLIANVNRDPKRKPQPYKAEDFIPKFGYKSPHGKREPMMAEGFKQFKEMALAAYGTRKDAKALKEMTERTVDVLPIRPEDLPFKLEH
jgi:hypothetical protein